MLTIILIIVGIIIGAAIYFGLGYYFAKSYEDAVFEKNGEWNRFNSFQKFQLGPTGMFEADALNMALIVPWSFLFWPIFLVIDLVAWVIAAICYGLYLLGKGSCGAFTKVLAKLKTRCSSI